MFPHNLTKVWWLLALLALGQAVALPYGLSPAPLAAWDPAGMIWDENFLRTSGAQAPEMVQLDPGLAFTNEVDITALYRREIPGNIHLIRYAYLMLRDASTGNWVVLMARRAGSLWPLTPFTRDVYAHTYARTGPGSEGESWRPASPVHAGSFPTVDIASAYPAVPIMTGTPAPAPFLTYVALNNIYWSSPNELQLTWRVRFKTPEVRGPVEIWTSAEDTTYYDGWDKYATIQMGRAPAVASALAPAEARAGTPASYTIAAEDADSVGDLRAVQAVFINQRTGGWFAAIYNAQGPKWQLYDDKGAYSPAVDAGAVSNAYATLDADKSTIATAGNRATANFGISLKAAWAGAEAKMYGLAVDQELNSSGLALAQSFAVR